MTNKEQRAKLAANERREGWQTIMSTPASRRVMWEIFEMQRLYQVAMSTDHGALAFSEGRRSVGIQVMDQMLAHCVDQHDRMVAENRHRMSIERAEEELERSQNELPDE